MEPSHAMHIKIRALEKLSATIASYRRHLDDRSADSFNIPVSSIVDTLFSQTLFMVGIHDPPLLHLFIIAFVGQDAYPSRSL